MTYVCLAAGKGTRFARLGSYLQKCMYPIGVFPFVEYSVSSILKSHSFDRNEDRLIFVIGHHGQQLRSYFENEYQGLSIDYVVQPEQLGTGHAIECAVESFRPGAPIITWLADLFVPPNLFDAVRLHAFDSVLTIATSDHETNDDVRVDLEDDRIIRAWRGAGELFDIGLWKLGPAILRSIGARKTDEHRVLVNVQAAIEAGVEVGFRIADEWIHLGGTEPTVSESLSRVSTRMSKEKLIDDCF